MPDNLQAFKAKWFCWHKVSSLSKCLCSRRLGSPLSSYSKSTSRAGSSRGQKTLPQGAPKFSHCKAATQISQIPLHCAAQGPMLPPSFLLCMVTTGAHPSLTASLPGTSSTLLQPSFKKTKNLSLPLRRRMLFPVSERVIPEQPYTCTRPKQMPPPPSPALGSYSEFRAAVAALQCF